MAVDGRDPLVHLFQVAALGRCLAWHTASGLYAYILRLLLAQ